MQGIASYQHVDNSNDITEFVIRYSPLIKRIANHIKCKLPNNIELDDLIQAGLIGLLDARNKFSEEKGASFETYASIKIRGAIIDEVRRITGITRDISQNIKTISTARAHIENTTEEGMSISSKDIATQMGITEKKYTNIMAEITTYQSMTASDPSMMEEIPGSKSVNPMHHLEKEDFKLALKTAIESLPKREQQILALYYNEELNFKEIADILSLTEARISQLHSLALAKIRETHLSLS